MDTGFNNVIEISNLTKNYGNKHVINDLNLTLTKGKILGILGPNGHGKTTLLNIISGLAKPTAGTVKICGVENNPRCKNHIAFLQEKDYLYKGMTVRDAVNFYTTFFKDFDTNKCRNLFRFMNIDERAKIKSLSKGMVEKVNLSLTLSRKCEIYILDEPISGVDINSRDKIINAIIDNIDENSSMIITTHYVGELEKLFDEVAFLGDGSIVEYGDAEDLRIKYGTSIDQAYRKIFAE